MATMVEVKCKCCGDLFDARLADRKRGWAKFCSKSCKAVKQEAKTHQMSKYISRKTRQGESDYCGPASMDMADWGQE